MSSSSSPNCWEYQNCGCEPGGSRVEILGLCPASVEPALDGIHDGVNGGRACWAVNDTLCSGSVSGPHERKIHECRKCSFYARVQIAQGFELVPDRRLRMLVQYDRVK